MIDYSNFTPLSAILGGSLIGASAIMLLFFNGKIAGISGIADKALNVFSNKLSWPFTFIAGLLVGSWASSQAIDSDITIETSWIMMALSGLLVGFGSRLGSGCTSGHGVCGIGRFSLRSIGATITFVGVAMLTVYVMKII